MDRIIKIVKNYELRIINRTVLLVLFFLFFNFIFLTNSAKAAQVYFDPQPSTHKVGDIFVLSVILDAEGQPINAVEVNILIPQLLRIKNISKNGSIIQLWVNEPSFSGNTINLIGGIPGGTTSSKGVIAKISFEAAAIGEGNIAFATGSSVLLNDGQGTKLDLKTTGGPVFNIVPRPKERTDSSEKETKKIKEEKDKEKPVKFSILFGTDPLVFGGDNFISFFTTDKGSGVEHYEVKLGKEPFRVAKSPYIIKDLESRSVIKVRAYDSSGNYRESIYPGLLKRSIWIFLKILHL